MKILLSLALLALPAFSTTITVDPTIPHLSQFLEIMVGGNIRTYDAGQIGVRFDGTDPAVLYSAEAFPFLLTGPTTVSTLTENLFPNAGQIAWLYNTYSPAVTQPYQAAALQLAIWEVSLDNNDGLINGLLRVSDNTPVQVSALSAFMLQMSAGQSSSGITFYVPPQNFNTHGQTLFGANSVQSTDTPEPANAILFGAGLLMLGAVRRRTRRQ